MDLEKYNQGKADHRDHWAEDLRPNDKVIATLRHPYDGQQNINNAEVTVIRNPAPLRAIYGEYNGTKYRIPYNELTEIK